MAPGTGDQFTAIAAVEVPSEAFTPAGEEITQARKLIEADAAAAAEGRGSFTVDGKMIDVPVIDRARRLLTRADAIDRRRSKVS